MIHCLTPHFNRHKWNSYIYRCYYLWKICLQSPVEVRQDGFSTLQKDALQRKLFSRRRRLTPALFVNSTENQLAYAEPFQGSNQREGKLIGLSSWRWRQITIRSDVFSEKQYMNLTKTSRFQLKRCYLETVDKHTFYKKIGIKQCNFNLFYKTNRMEWNV